MKCQAVGRYRKCVPGIGGPTHFHYGLLGVSVNPFRNEISGIEVRAGGHGRKESGGHGVVVVMS